MKLYARFQRREIMHCMVKINLEEQADPLLSGTMGTSTLVTYKGDVMDVEETVGLQEEAWLAVQFSLRGVHGGT